MRSLLKLKVYLKDYWLPLTGSLLLAIPLAGLRAGPVPLVKYLFDDLLLTKDRTKLIQFPALVIGMYLLNFVIRFAHFYLMRSVISRVDQRIKNDLNEHLLDLSADYFSDRSVGTLMSRVSSDPQTISIGLGQLNSFVRDPLTFLLLFGYAFYLNWRLTVMTFLILPILAWIFAVSGRHLKRYMIRMAEENAELFATMQESFTGIRVVKLFQLEKYARKKFRERSENFRTLSMKTALVEEASHPAVELVTAFLIALVFYYGGEQVLSGKMKIGELVGFFASFGLMIHPLRTLNDLNIKIAQTAAAVDRVFDVLHWKSRLVEAKDPVPLRTFEKELVFSDVKFAYPDLPERGVLKGVSFALSRGRVVALVGASGSGKSSLVSLIPRIFDVTGGQILIDGADIRSVALTDLRRLVAVVSQEVFLFNDSIEENIRCGRFSATRKEVREAARRAHALDFIESMPHGFKTTIGDRGQKLSGGERQRISIARAFLREAPILILDEATSSLDTASERAVQQALDELMVNRTTLVIAHRLSTVRNADEILVIRDGEIVERGRHEQLLVQGGQYAQFHQH